MLASRLMWFSNLSHSLAADTLKDFSPCIAVWVVVASKVNKIQITAFSRVYSFNSDRLDTAFSLSTLNMWNRILQSNLKSTENQCRWNKIGIIWFFCECLSPNVHYGTWAFFQREIRILYNNALSLSSREIISDRTKAFHLPPLIKINIHSNLA